MATKNNKSILQYFHITKEGRKDNSITSHNHTTSMATKNNKSILQYFHRTKEGRKIVTASVKAINYQGYLVIISYNYEIPKYFQKNNFSKELKSNYSIVLSMTNRKENL